MSQLGRKLGEILIDKGLISDEQLQMALSDQKITREFLGRVLIKNGWVSEIEVMKGLSEQFGIPFIEFELSMVDWAVVAQYSYALLSENNCIPISQDSTTVTVVISDPLNVWIVSEIESQSRGRNTQLMLAMQHEIKAALKEFTKRYAKQ